MPGRSYGLEQLEYVHARALSEEVAEVEVEPYVSYGPDGPVAQMVGHDPDVCRLQAPAVWQIQNSSPGQTDLTALYVL